MVRQWGMIVAQDFSDSAVNPVLKSRAKWHHYLCQEGYVFIGVCLFVCHVSRIMQKLLNWFSQNSVDRHHTGHDRNRWILVMIWPQTQHNKDRHLSPHKTTCRCSVMLNSNSHSKCIYITQSWCHPKKVNNQKPIMYHSDMILVTRQ